MGAIEASNATNALPYRAGWFRFRLADQSWEWSAEVERVHGYDLDDVLATNGEVPARTHPDDRVLIEETLNDVARTGRPFRTRHRVVDDQGRVHEVVTGGDSFRDAAGTVIGTHGFYVDVTPTSDREHQQSVSDAVAEIAESRSAIEQAKGMLMLVYRIDSEAAFGLLKWRSQEGNVKLRAIAEQIIADFTSLTYRDVLPSRSSYDELLLTAHDRIGGGR